MLAFFSFPEKMVLNDTPFIIYHSSMKGGDAV